MLFGATRIAQSRPGEAVKSAVDSFIRQANTQGPETQSRLQRAAKEYDRLWREGSKVDSPEMVDVFLDLIGWLRIAGGETAPQDNAALAALKKSPCWQLGESSAN